MIIYVQNKALKGYAEKLKEKLNYALKEANDAKLAQKEEKYQVLDFQERTDKTILKLATPKSSARLNIQRLKEEQDEAMNSAKDNDTTENIEELDKFRKILEDKKLMLLKLVRSETCLCNNLRHCNRVLMEGGKNQRKEPKPSNYYRKT